MFQFKTTVKYIRRSPYQAVNAVMIIVLTLFLSSIFSIAVYTSQNILKFYEGKAQINVFFKDEIPQEKIDKLESALNETKKIAKMKFVSKKEALERYREQNKNDPLLLEMVTENLLPASLEISAINAQFLKDINEILKKEEGIEEIVYQKEIIDNITKWTITLKKIGLFFLAYLILVCVLTIVTIVGTKISSRKEEIEVEKLLGASNWYVRTPFILEAALYGAAAAVISWLVFYLTLVFSFPYFSSFFRGDIASFVPVFLTTPLTAFASIVTMLKLFLFELLFGVIVSVFASTIAATRYLKD